MKRAIIIFILALSIGITLFYWFYKLQFGDPDTITLSPNVSRTEIYKATIKYQNKNSCKYVSNGQKKTLSIQLQFQYPIIYFNGAIRILDIAYLENKRFYERRIYLSKNLEKKILIEHIFFKPQNGIKNELVISFIEKSGESYSWRCKYNPYIEGDTINLNLLLTQSDYTLKNQIEIIN